MMASTLRQESGLMVLMVFHGVKKGHAVCHHLGTVEGFETVVFGYCYEFLSCHDRLLHNLTVFITHFCIAPLGNISENVMV